jgi:hypothetical protein
MSHVRKFHNFYICMQKHNLVCNFLLPTILTCIVQPFDPSIAVDNRSYFSFLDAHACTCMGPAFPLLSVKVAFNRMWASSTADKVNIRHYILIRSHCSFCNSGKKFGVKFQGVTGLSLIISDSGYVMRHVM